MSTNDTNDAPLSHTKYAKEAYAFVSQALEFTLKQIGERRHVSGTELLEGLRHLAIDKFGYLALTVFEIWGVRNTDDFGQIVFDLIASGNMSRTDEDTIADFHAVYHEQSFVLTSTPNVNTIAGRAADKTAALGSYFIHARL